MARFKLTNEGEAELDSLDMMFDEYAKCGQGISTKEAIRHRLLLALTPTRGDHRGFEPDIICALAPGFTPDRLVPWMDFFANEGWVEVLS